MKYFIAVTRFSIVATCVMLMTFSCGHLCRAEDWKLSLRHNFNQSRTSDCVTVEGGNEVRAAYKNFILSGERTEFNVYNGSGVSGTLTSVGAGLQHPITRSLTVWGMITGNYPDYDDRVLKPGDPHWEGAMEEANRRAHPTYAPTTWAGYKNEFKPAIGARIGIDYTKEIFKGFSVLLSGGYSLLTIKRTLFTYDAGGNIAWEFATDEQFGGPQAGIGFSYAF